MRQGGSAANTAGALAPVRLCAVPDPLPLYCCGDILGTEEDIEFSSFFYILGIFNPVDSLLNIGNIFNLVCRSTTPAYDMYEHHFLSQKF